MEKQKQKIELVTPYAESANGCFFHFQNMPPEVVKKLLSGWPNADKKDRQNRSPTLKKMLDLASRHNGSLSGYCIPVESGRSDARISFEEFTLHITKQEAMKLKRSLKPDNLTELEKDTYSFWWD